MADWNPNLYLKFKKERTQPAKDLISRIDVKNPLRIIDIGCGPGNSTKELNNKWPNAEIIGLDSSENMIEAAKKEMLEINWIVGDASGDLSYLGKFDIVFSNAMIQWVDNQELLLKQLFSIVKEGGVLAVQVPNDTCMKIRLAVEKVAKTDKWINYFDFEYLLFMYSPQHYYDSLSSLNDEVYVWETNYYHIMNNHREIVDWYKSTGMKPYLDKLSVDELKEEFLDDVLNIVEKEYAVQKNGKVLFPFRRIFFTVYK